MQKLVLFASAVLAASSLLPPAALAQPSLIAHATLTGSRAGHELDLSGLNYTLENGVPASLLGGLGSGIAFAPDGELLAVPDRGPNAVPFNPAVDDTVSYINRFQSIGVRLTPAAEGSSLPFSLAVTLNRTTLLHALLPLTYGSGQGLNLPSGRPAANNFFTHYFTGRSDGFDPGRDSGYPLDARLDPESIRVSPDGLTVFLSDEYGPYIYQFLRATGERLRTYRLPDDFFVSHLSPVGKDEISGNVQGRTANKGMEGLALTPDGRTLVGILQNSLIQDASEGGAAASMLRIVTLDVLTGRVLHQYAYNLTTGSGVSDIVAINSHEFLVDERDGKGLGDGSKAKVKQFFKIDLAGATDVSAMNGTAAAAAAVPKTLFADLVQVLGAAGYAPTDIPAKIEGLAFGADVHSGGRTLHTLWVANDNDFLADYNGVTDSNPSQFFVLGFTDADLNGSVYNPGPLSRAGRR